MKVTELIAEIKKRLQEEYELKLEEELLKMRTTRNLRVVEGVKGE